MIIHLRKATEQDRDAIWKIMERVLATGDTYVFAPGTPKEAMLAYWMDPVKYTYVATLNEEVVGTFMLKDNQPGLGAHVANGSYMVSPDKSGLGIGRRMGAFSLEEARRLGYQAMQFNIVVKSNQRAVKLWQQLGFSIIGEIPEAYRHAQLGLVNAYIMYQKL